MAEVRKKPVKLEWQGGLATDGGAIAVRGSTGAALAPKPETLAGKQSVIRSAKMRREVKGRSGHPVLVLWGFEPPSLPEMVFEKLCSTLKGQLGCGGTCEAGTVVLQTENGERLAAALKKLGIACKAC